MRYNIKPNSFAKVKRNHLIFGTLYLLFGLFIFIGSFTIRAVKAFTPSLYTDYIAYTRVSGQYPWNSIYQITVDMTNRLILIFEKVPFMLIVGIILILSAVIHIIVILKKVNANYNSNLQLGVVRSRAIEGMITSVLLPLLAILIGVNDTSVILLLLVLGIVYNFLSLSMEQVNSKQEKSSWGNFIAMCLIFIFSAGSLVITILKQLEIQQTLIDNATISLPYLKNFNFIVLGIYFGFWFISLINTFLQHKKVAFWKNPVFVENVNIVLGFVTKVAIVFMLFYGLVNKLFTIYYTNL